MIIGDIGVLENLYFIGLMSGKCWHFVVIYFYCISLFVSKLSDCLVLSDGLQCNCNPNGFLLNSSLWCSLHSRQLHRNAPLSSSLPLLWRIRLEICCCCFFFFFFSSVFFFSTIFFYNITVAPFSLLSSSFYMYVYVIRVDFLRNE